MINIYNYISKIIKDLKLKNDKRTIIRSGYFDEAYYMETNPDVAKSMHNALDHYIDFGAKEGRPTSVIFDTSYYLKTYPDVIDSGLNPLIHFLKVGVKEKRKTVSDEPKPHFNKTIVEYSLVVPFSYPIEQATTPGTICVNCHIYYMDLIEDICAGLHQIPFHFDIYLTTDTENKKELLESCFAKRFQGKTYVCVFPNRGRDIAPFLTAWPKLFDQYDFVLHIHSKKSLYNPTLEEWRSFLFKHLLGDRDTIRSIFEIFMADKLVGMIAPIHYGPIRKTIGWGYNYPQIKQLATKIGITLHDGLEPDFPSGSMFWARTSALKPLLKLQLKVEDFPEESGQNDNTLAHALERMFYITCEQAGYYWYKIQHLTVVQSANRPTFILSKRELGKVLQHSRKKLLTEK